VVKTENPDIHYPFIPHAYESLLLHRNLHSWHEETSWEQL